MVKEKNSEEKSRREKRKEARFGKKAQKHQAWLQHQEYRNLRKKPGNSNSKKVSKLNNLLEQNVQEKEILQSKGKPERHQNSETSNKPLSVGLNGSSSSKVVERKKGSKGNLKKTKFEEYLEMGMQSAAASAEEDLELERKLAKKLKVKSGKLRGEDDDVNLLFEGFPSIIDSLGEELPIAEGFPDKSSKSKKLKKKKLLEEGPESDILGDPSVRSSKSIETCDALMSEDVPADAPLRKKRRKRKLLEQGKNGDVVGDTNVSASKPVVSCAAEVVSEEVPGKAPAGKGDGKYVAPHSRACSQKESEQYLQIRRHIRGLLNRLSESNVESITGEISRILLSIARGTASQIISEEVLASCSGGPRGNEQYAAVFGAFVAGMACLVGIDFSAKLMASLALCFEDEYHKEDTLSLRNLSLLLSYLYIFGVCSSELIYDFLIMLSKRLTEIDVSTILTTLQCCGMKIRSDDPSAMKNFILSIQNRVNELKASSGDGQQNINSKRMEFMLETICDIKNNKKRPKEDPAHHTRIKKWLQKLRVEDVLIRGLKWSKLVDPEKKGQWWLSGDMASTMDNVKEVASNIDKEVLEAQKMLQLAAAQRMNTDARRAIFCIVMSGEDYIDTFEKLLRLDLHGKQDREIMRVLVECCLQEKVFNKYYTVLASKLCEHDKNHKFTLQFCLWDHFKELESMQHTRSLHLAKFAAEMLASFTLSLAVLKSVELGDIRQLTPRRIMHFRMLFEALFEYSDKLIWNIFTRVAVTPDLESLRHGIEFFIKEYVVKTNKAITEKFRVVKRALNNAEGILM
ncbi:nucleolar MIF4G domain-containing protein 1-like [Juglans regia]|uniref:Nucleolar MIF4G domain-containing protein 1-like n=1 Tax=Juglans regia TaxID=51240 RepID=A0A6P9EB28_JUGRE|nr:nucleolar MIF4G domain-containing protein 1-like [Juglans regia]XP_035544530.1 nucleolar MIF4G domain-containing protein 1-like [Juglans regia]XP_035544531.1 nucleolar MIF4G domain-containing protein 1-like [Juglans regia]XP_035544532.1 nucleolar MIF4G domain-containing protein 1-like [Juglans regia]XP_035544533.1 nucleolar MIF4G domain-containing protein 1-like [Juglans regia]